MKNFPPFTPGVYQHFKGPKYRALFLAQDSTNPFGGEATEDPMVVYVSLDVPHQGNICARELKQWEEVVPWPDGKSRSRFQWVGP